VREGDRKKVCERRRERGSERMREGERGRERKRN